MAYLFNIFIMVFLLCGLTPHQTVAGDEGISEYPQRLLLESMKNQIDAAYLVRPDDVLKIKVFGENDLSDSYKVKQDYTITMPLIGTINVSNTSLTTLQKSITAELKDGYLINPNVTIDLISSHPFYIMGEVNAPGRYDYIQGMNVIQAIATAGGMTDHANKRMIDVLRKSRNPGESVMMPLEGEILPSDIIYVRRMRD